MSVWCTHSQTRGASRHVAGAATKVRSANSKSLGPARPQRRVVVATTSTIVARAEGQDADGSGQDPGTRSSVASLTLEEAYGVLGLSPGAPYDDVLARKSKLLEECKSNPEKALLVECANDTILSSNLQARLSGQLKVSSSVKYADVKKASSGSRKAIEGVAAKLQAVPQMTNNLLTVRPLQGQEAAKVSAVFASLLLWDVAQGIASGGSPTPYVPGLQLAFGVAAVVYFQREKRVGLGKSFAIAVAGLVVGSVVGSALESYLRVDIVPFLGIDSPAVVISGGSLVALFGCAMLLA
jgi:hypothetical protein